MHQDHKEIRMTIFPLYRHVQEPKDEATRDYGNGDRCIRQMYYLMQRRQAVNGSRIGTRNRKRHGYTTQVQ